MRLIKNLAFCAALASGVVSCAGNQSKKTAQEAGADSLAAARTVADSIAQTKKAEAVESKLATLPEEPVFEMITSLGTIKIKLYANTPAHRENFARLALGGYYNGLLFHRVINGFMIQGGDPLSRNPESKDRWGTGGPDYTVPAEIVPANRHKKGALAAARRSDAANPKRESSGSQFYLVQNEASCAQLDGAYTVYGETVSGLEVIDAIAAVETDMRDRPLNDVRIIAVKLSE